MYSIYKKDSRGDDRQLSLLRKVGAENCAVPIDKSYVEINPNYNVEIVSKNLSALKIESIDYLKKAVTE